ncbi:MAG TPA: ATP-binding protein [Candidatus Peribacteraceae bacterium]|nr:ATP-binding protein [Candidatus Peribacteraceae bacterium]
MKIVLPHSAWLGNIDPFLRSLDLSNPDYLDITSNPEWTSLHPIVLSMVGALGMNVQPENIRHDIKARSAPYLERMGLFQLWGIESGMHVTEHEAAGRFIPLTIIRTEQELSKLIENIIPIFHLADYPEQADTMRYIVDEMTRNVIEHAGMHTNAVVCVQYYQRSKKIRIGIADTGLGLRTTLSRHHPIQSHLHAIQQALWPGITGTTDAPGGSAQNAGAGLFFTKSMARVNKDHFLIYSGDAMYKLLEPKEEHRLRIPVDPFNDRHTKAEGLPFWQGTAVGIDITLEQTQQFQVLLSALNTVLEEANRERKRKMSLKKPRFL